MSQNSMQQPHCVLIPTAALWGKKKDQGADKQAQAQGKWKQCFCHYNKDYNRDLIYKNLGIVLELIVNVSLQIISYSEWLWAIMKMNDL